MVGHKGKINKGEVFLCLSKNKIVSVKHEGRNLLRTLHLYATCCQNKKSNGKSFKTIKIKLDLRLESFWRRFSLIYK